MTPLQYLTQVKDHVTETNPNLSEVERVRLRSVTIKYRPPATDVLVELEDILNHGHTWGVTGLGLLPDGHVGNTGNGAWETGPITIWGHSHMDMPLCALAFTLLHEMGHVLTPDYDGPGHTQEWADACARLGIEEHPYASAGKNARCFEEHHWPIHHFTDKALLAYVEGLGPITDWYAKGLYRPIHDRID